MRVQCEKLYSIIQSKGRLLTDDEVFNFYSENVQRTECKFVVVNGRFGLGRYDHYTKADIEAKAHLFYFRTLGKIVASGAIKVSI